MVLDWRDEAELHAQLSAFNLPLFNCIHIIAHTKIPAGFAAENVSVIPHDAEAFARALYGELHRCDAAGAGLIVVEAPPESPAWSAASPTGCTARRREVVSPALAVRQVQPGEEGFQRKIVNGKGSSAWAKLVQRPGSGQRSKTPPAVHAALQAFREQFAVERVQRQVKRIDRPVHVVELEKFIAELSVVQAHCRSPYHATAQGMSLIINSSGCIQPAICCMSGG